MDSVCDACLAATAAPTSTPTPQPTTAPTFKPTSTPTGQPTVAPTSAPTTSPSDAPTLSPTLPSCQDFIKNGEETDVDCGGNECHSCNPGQSCSANADCYSQLCESSVCSTPAPTPVPTTLSPTKLPTKTPTTSPSLQPTGAPTATPSAQPTWSPTSTPTFVPTTPTNSSLEVIFSNLYVHVLKDHGVVPPAIVFKLTSFADPRESQKLFTETVIQAWKFAIRTASLQGGRKLIVDLIGNPGGYVSLPNMMLQILVGYESRYLCEPYDFKQNPQLSYFAQHFIGKAQPRVALADFTDSFIDKLVDKLTHIMQVGEELLHQNSNDVSAARECIRMIKLFSPPLRQQKLDSCLSLLDVVNLPAREWGERLSVSKLKYSSLDKVLEFGDIDYFLQPVTARRGGQDVKLTQKFHANCDGEARFDSMFNGWGLRSNMSGLVDNVIVLTDGTCSGACSQFASKLYVDNLATTVTFGGVDGEELDISGHNDGTVEAFENVWRSELFFYMLGTTIFNMTGSLAVKDAPLPLLPLPTRAKSSVGFNEQYLQQLGDDALPREWYLIPGSHRLRWWPSTDLTSIAEETAKVELSYLYTAAAKLPAKCVRGQCGYVAPPPTEFNSHKAKDGELQKDSHIPEASAGESGSAGTSGLVGGLVAAVCVALAIAAVAAAVVIRRRKAGDEDPVAVAEPVAEVVAEAVAGAAGAAGAVGAGASGGAAAGQDDTEDSTAAKSAANPLAAVTKAEPMAVAI